MTTCGHLWAVGFDDVGRAAQVRDEVARLGSEKHDLVLVDSAVAVRYADGSFTLNGEPFPVVIKIHSGTLAHLLASLALGAPPLTGAAVGTLLSRPAKISMRPSGGFSAFVQASDHHDRTQSPCVRDAP